MSLESRFCLALARARAIAIIAFGAAVGLAGTSAPAAATGKETAKARKATSASVKATRIAKSTRVGKAVAVPARNPGVAARGSRPARVAVAGRSGRAVKVSAVQQRSVVPQRVSIGHAIGLHQVDDPLDLKSAVAVVVDQATGETLYQKNPQAVLPIASITKVMTAMVVLDADLPMDEMLQIGEEDRDLERFTRSRLHVGARLSRREMMSLALMSSENRAAHALCRTYPGGLRKCVAAMNEKARALGMTSARFVEPTGLSSSNVSSAVDLARLVQAAASNPVIRQYSTDAGHVVYVRGRPMEFHSTNSLVQKPGWQVTVQKTGYIAAAGRCLVMQAVIEGRDVVIVLLNSWGKLTRIADAKRVRDWVETSRPFDSG